MKNIASKNFYSAYSYNSKQKRQYKFKKIFIIAVVFILITIVVIFSVFNMNKKNDYFHDYIYLVVVGKFDKISDAKDLADNVKIAGGAGYIWIDSVFWVVAFVYKTEDAALSVKNQLQEGVWKCSIEKIKFEEIKYKKLNINQELAIKFLIQYINDFYDYAIMIDTDETQNASIHKKIIAKKNELTLLINKLGQSELDVLISSALQNIYDGLVDFLKSSFPQNLYSSGIKELCINAIYLYINIANNIIKSI